MINYITKQTYTGKNWDILGSEGFEILLFRYF